MKTNNYIPRSLEKYAFDEDLTGRHMVFLAGARQVGKTMLARHWLEKKGCSSLYFNWDDIKTRQSYLADSRFFESSARMLGLSDPWIVFDEIHKRNHWRDILKGGYDLFSKEFRFLITGSARLDLFRRSGDSLVGRYNLFHMFPFTISEVTALGRSSSFLKEEDFKSMSSVFEKQVSFRLSPETNDAYTLLWQNGPFPEPFLKHNDRFSRKWHQDYLSLVVRQDLKDLTRVAELDKIEHLVSLLPSRVMSPLSMANLSRELEVAHTTVKNWLEQLKRLYLLFSVDPWTQNISRGLKREKKWYFLDWYYVPQSPARLENMVAANLYRACQTLTDRGYGLYRLYYIRTLDKKEIDFVVTVDRKPILCLEVKTGETNISNTLINRQRWFPNQPTLGVQVVDQKGILKKLLGNTWVISVDRFLSVLD
jgi:predicted AAA+ superfamily ATPase